MTCLPWQKALVLLVDKDQMWIKMIKICWITFSLLWRKMLRDQKWTSDKCSTLYSIINKIKLLKNKLINLNRFGQMTLIKEPFWNQTTQSLVLLSKLVIRDFLKRSLVKKWKFKWKDKRRSKREWPSSWMLIQMMLKLKKLSRRRLEKVLSNQTMILLKNSSQNSLVKFVCFMLMSLSIRNLSKHSLILEHKPQLFLKIVQQHVESCTCSMTDLRAWQSVLDPQESWEESIWLIWKLEVLFCNVVSLY